MVRKEVIIHNREGLGSRPAALLVKTASKYMSRIVIEHGAKVINARSMMGVLSLGVGNDQRVAIVTEGEDEQEALSALVSLIESNFQEGK